MICSICNKPATDNACAYYRVVVRKEPEWIVTKCWHCLTPAEKAERDPGAVNRVRFELIKSLRPK